MIMQDTFETQARLNSFSILWGTGVYEFKMQIRRRAVWITLFLIGAFVLALLLRYAAYSHSLDHLDQLPILTVVANWAHIVNAVLPVGIGALVADRLIRDKRIKVDDLFLTFSSPLSMRIAGKFLGSLCATLVPLLVFYGAGLLYIAIVAHNVQAFLWGLVTFAAIILPGAIFISAFSFALPVIMWVPLYQFCFIGYWFWGNHLSPNSGIPTISDTILTPIGKYAEEGFFHNGAWWNLNSTPLIGTESLLLLIGLALAVLALLCWFLRWQQNRQ